jgi:hypothetical protein
MDMRAECDKQDKDIGHLKEKVKIMQDDTFFLDQELHDS